jgi:NADH-quinone oxidoreductase subunit M
MPGAYNALGFPLLTIMLFIPAAGGVVCWALEGERQVRIVAALTVVLEFALAMFLLAEFEIRPHGSAVWMFQFSDRTDWISTLGINYWVGVDGISVFLVGLTTLITAVAVFASMFMIADRLKMFTILTLFLETAILGVFMSVNLFLFFVFWEAMLIPAYFLLGIWGEERRVYATMKFVIYTVAGSFLMLVGIFYLWSQVGTLDMAGPGGLLAHPISEPAQTWVFLAFGIAFAIKLPLFPFHTWAPTAYAESPIPVVLLIAGVLSKAGAFGFLRYCLPLFPVASRHFSGSVSVLAVIGMIYAAGLALVQTDIKRIVAYASISHMNLIALGIFALNATGFDGSVLQMINHSVIICGLFLAVGYIAARTGTRMLPNLGGLGTNKPFLMWMFFVFVLGGLDLPGLGSFAGEFLVLLGAFRANVWYSSVAALTVILAAWYMIRFFQDTMNGPVVAAPAAVAEAGAEDLSRTVYEYPVRRRLLSGDIQLREALLFIPLMILILYIGIQPDPLTTRMNSTTNTVARVVHPGAPAGAVGGAR